MRNFYTLLFEDDNMIAVSKEHGVYVIPDRQGLCGDTLLDVLTRDFGKLYTVHRLDAGTGGVIIYAKSAYAHQKLCYLFENRLVEKTYVAITEGRPYDQTLMLPLAQGGKGRYKINFKSGKKSLTTFNVLQSLNGYSVIRAQPLTGRTHQIRVHLKALKAPLYWDWLYNKNIGDKRISLFARRISFLSPFNGQTVSITAPFSAFMLEVAQKLELSLKDVY